MHFRKIFTYVCKKMVRLFSGTGISKLPLVNTLYNRLITFLWLPGIPVDVLDYKMIVDRQYSRWLLTKDTLEPMVTDLIIREVKTGNTAIDVGANIGYHTLLFAKLTGETGKVFAFEPAPDNFKLLRKNILLNGYNNVIPIQKAVSNRTGTTRLFLSSKSILTHRIFDDHDGRSYIDVETSSLDDFFNKHMIIVDFVKIDVEGAEPLVVQGMQTVLRSNQRIKIIMEFSPKNLCVFGFKPVDLLNLLLSNGFTILNINGETMKIEHVNVDYLLNTYTPDKSYSTNLFCLRK